MTSFQYKRWTDGYAWYMLIRYKGKKAIRQNKSSSTSLYNAYTNIQVLQDTEKKTNSKANTRIKINNDKRNRRLNCVERRWEIVTYTLMIIT